MAIDLILGFRYMIGLLSVVISSAVIAGELRCVETSPKTFVILNAAKKVIGNPVGYSTADSCQKVIDTSQITDLVCSWNGQAYQYYSTETGAALWPDNYFDTLDFCGSLLRKQPTGQFMCVWTGSRYAPYNRATQKIIGGDKNGWERIDSCLEGSAAKAKGKMICSWTDNKPGLYDSDGKNLIDFGSQKECDNFIESIPNNEANQKAIYDNILKGSVKSKNPLPVKSNLCLSAKEGIERGCARNKLEDNKCYKPQLAYYGDSCLANEDKSDLIKNIINMKNGETIPPYYYYVYDSEKIARSLVYRIYRDLEMSKTSIADQENPGYDFYGDSEIQIAFEEQVFSKIVEGGFLNQHQTLTTNGRPDRGLRLRVEEGLLGISLETDYSNLKDAKVHVVQPKYTYWVPMRNHKDIQPHNYSKSYGNTFAVFKNSVKKRATFSNADTLAYENDSQRIIHTFSYVTANPQITKRGDYYEAQVWGELDMSHVKYLLVDCSGQSASTASLLKQAQDLIPNIPIFSCAEKTDSQLYAYVPAKLLQGKIEGSGISIIKATKAGPETQKKFSVTCENRIECDFDVKSLTDQSKFSVSYVCTGKSPKVITIANQAQTASVSIDCEKDTYKVKYNTVIKITSATYGTGLPGIKLGNVTEAAAKFCDGKNTCDYAVKTKFIGDPAPGVPKAFDITWDCLGGNKKNNSFKTSIPADATDKSIKIQCQNESSKD